MERGNFIKWLFLGVALFVTIQYVIPAFTGENEPSQLQPLAPYVNPPADKRAEEAFCDLKGPRFEAQLTSRGASLTHVRMLDDKYRTEGPGVGDPIDLVTTSNESYRPLRSDLRVHDGEDGEQQVPFNNLDWKLEKSSESSCTFVYETESAKVVKTVAVTERPFELAVAIDVQNLADAPKKHRLAVEQTDYRTTEETEGSLGRISEFMTRTEFATPDDIERLDPSEFEPEDFEGEPFTAESWYQAPGAPSWVAASNSYFTKALIPLEAPASPHAEALIEESWDNAKYKRKESDPSFGHIYRARLAYPVQELPAGESAHYEMLAFVGPKERDVLSNVGGHGDDRHRTSELIDMGFFGAIGRVLVSYVYILFDFVGSWGWAIVLLTITVKVLLFPLSLGQIKNSAAMRRLKPEIDEINEKYKEDFTQRGVAMQELYRKHGLGHPLASTAKGCVPMLLQMPVWLALYTVLQSAVELYHTSFGPVIIPDLSKPGKYFIIPIVLGLSSFAQQKLMPPMGDAQQQKTMMFVMPAVFTVMMLFLPAGLGVYMLTNVWLGVIQQLLVERYIKSRQPATGSIEVRDVTDDGDEGASRTSKSSKRSAMSAPTLGKGKARVRG